MTEEVSLTNDQRFPNGAAHRRRLITLKQVAELLNVNERHVRRLVFERRIPYFKWGHYSDSIPSSWNTGWNRPASGRTSIRDRCGPGTGGPNSQPSVGLRSCSGGRTIQDGVGDA
jgi:excisionase family DNA binding protein